MSVQFSCSVVSNSLRPHELQHSRPPCLSPTPRVHPNPCPLCQWCHPTISSSVVPFSSCPQAFPASGSFQMSQLFASGGQSIGVFASGGQSIQASASTTPRVHPNPCPLSWWCHLTISSSVVPFSSCLQSFPTSDSFQMSQRFTSGGQNIGVSASTSVFPMNTEDWSPLGWTGWISLQSKGLSRIFSNTTVQNQFFGTQLSL